MITNPKILEGFEVEWCSDLGNQTDPTSFNPDVCRYSFRDFKTKAEAIRFAHAVYPQCKIGDVRVTPFHLEQIEPGIKAYRREYDGDSDFINDIEP